MKKFFIGVSLLLCSFAPVHAATVNVVVNDPDPLTIGVGETFTVTVSNVAFPSTGGATLGIIWDAAILDLVSMSTPTFEFVDPAAPTQPQQDAGEVTLFSFSNINPLNDPSGNFDSFVLEFIAQAIGTSAITIDESAAFQGWFDSGGSPITVDTYNQGSVTVVSAVPVPAAVWLFGSALGVLGWLRRRTA